MGLFVSLLIDPVTCRSDCSICREVCPVDIFVKDKNLIMVVKEREDECTLCNLCLEKCPTKAITLQKHYWSYIIVSFFGRTPTSWLPDADLQDIGIKSKEWRVRSKQLTACLGNTVVRIQKPVWTEQSPSLLNSDYWLLNSRYWRESVEICVPKLINTSLWWLLPGPILAISAW